jgi:hypothetical protein
VNAVRLALACGIVWFGHAVVSRSDGAAPSAGHSPDAASVSPVESELVALERFLSSSDAELDDLRRAIDRVRALSPEERRRLLERIVTFRALPESQRAQVRAGWGWVDARDRREWPEYMHALEAEERRSVQSAIEALPPQKRAAYKHALLERWRAQRAAAP